MTAHTGRVQGVGRLVQGSRDDNEISSRFICGHRRASIKRFLSHKERQEVRKKLQMQEMIATDIRITCRRQSNKHTTRSLHTFRTWSPCHALELRAFQGQKTETRQGTTCDWVQMFFMFAFATYQKSMQKALRSLSASPLPAEAAPRERSGEGKILKIAISASPDQITCSAYQ